MKKFKFNIEGKAYEVTINKAQNGVVDINVNDKNFVVEIEKGKPVVTPPAPAPRPQLIEQKPAVTHKVSTENQPLTIMKIYVTTGQTVKKGDKLFTMISDGKECDITADKDGQVERINVVVGQNIPSEGASIELKNCGQSSTSQNFSTENATLATRRQSRKSWRLGIDNGFYEDGEQRACRKNRHNKTHDCARTTSRFGRRPVVYY